MLSERTRCPLRRTGGDVVLGCVSGPGRSAGSARSEFYPSSESRVSDPRRSAGSAQSAFHSSSPIRIAVPP